MGPAIFWGLFLIFIGFALIIKYVFNLDIPVGKIVIALFFIFIGKNYFISLNILFMII